MAIDNDVEELRDGSLVDVKALRFEHDHAKNELYQARRNLAAVKIYCEGVRDDFPTLKTVMDNIIKLASQSV